MSDIEAELDRQWKDDLAAMKDSSNWQIRIEALRAAAQITAPMLPGPIVEHETDEPISTVECVLRSAKRFERYLESGE